MSPNAPAAMAVTGSPDTPHNDPARQGLAALGLAALGVVYGDIGTSPLYTVKEIFQPATGVALTPANLVGAVSAIVWALMLVVTLKYVLLVLRADHRGEGGGLALTALATETTGNRPRLRQGLLLLGITGAALFYGDSVITPAISVMGAMEGLVVITPALTPWVLPASLAVLVALFLVQRFGTAAVGRWFGPVILLWFATLAMAGLVQISRTPAILAALNPLESWQFLSGRGAHLLPALGAIVLALTGAEALYADLGHFGRRPIQWAWCGLVLPALALNYLGQGALLVAEPAAIDNPFYRLFPAPLLVPALVLATLAAIIASQAVISGAYSMTRQAMQLGLLPRLTVRHTSASAAGQIYMPGVNTVLLLGVVAVVLGFGSSGALAGAYGLAVTLTMAITTVLGWFVLRQGRHLPVLLTTPMALFFLTLFFLTLDGLLVAGCAVKFLDGGWATLAMAAALLAAMGTWARGRAQLMDALRSDGLALAPFVHSLDMAELPRCTRTAVYPVADASLVPQALLHNLKHNQVLHARNLVLTVQFASRPWVPKAEQLKVEPLGSGFWRVTLLFGFMDEPDVPRALADSRWTLLAGDPMATSWFLSRETVVPGRDHGMALWQQRLFAAMARRASRATDYFRLPDNAVVELGTRVQLQPRSGRLLPPDPDQPFLRHAGHQGAVAPPQRAAAEAARAAQGR